LREELNPLVYARGFGGLFFAWHVAFFADDAKGTKVYDSRDEGDKP
jgi:hypothetical protein